MTQSSFDAPCTPLYGGTDTGLYVLSLRILLTLRVFLYTVSSYRIASLFHWELITTIYPAGNLLLKTYAFFSIPRHMMELIVLIGFLLDETHLDPLSPGRKHCGQSLWPGHGFCSESWAGRQQQLVHCFQGKGTGHRQAVGVQCYEVLVGSIYSSLSTRPLPQVRTD